MSTKWISIGLAFICTCLVYLAWAPLAAAQTDTPPQDTTCWSCHETQYWCHEKGHWCCFSDPQRACTDCHGGDDTTWDKDQAHVSMIKNPIAENPDMCKECHPGDSAERIETFAAAAGMDPCVTPFPTSTPYPAVLVASSNEPTPPTFLGRHLEPWRIVGLGFIGLLSIGLAVFGYRCWKADCISKKITLIGENNNEHYHA